MDSATGKAFRPPLWATLVLLVGVAICGTAGFWQLGRSGEKREMFAAFERSDDALPRHGLVADAEAERHLYGRFALTGRYLPERQILLDNMTHDGRSGYHVLTPFRSGADVVLVNRGWLPTGPDRAALPDIAVRDTMRDVVGRLNRLPRAGFALEPAEPDAGAAWPRRLSFPTAAEISAHLGFPVHDYQLLLDPGGEDGYTREWRPALMPPEKHLAYAIQWFGLAATMVIIYVALTIRAARGRRAHDKPE